MRKKAIGLVGFALSASLIVAIICLYLSSPVQSGSLTSESVITTEAQPTVAVSPAVVPISRETEVVIMGSGYEPGQEIRVVIRYFIEGVDTDITWGLLYPLPEEAEDIPSLKVNEQGAWIKVLDKAVFNNWTRRKSRLKEEAYTLMVTDSNLMPLTYTTIAFYDPTKDRGEWPTWAQIAVPSE